MDLAAVPSPVAAKFLTALEELEAVILHVRKAHAEVLTTHGHKLVAVLRDTPPDHALVPRVRGALRALREIAGPLA